MGPMQLLLLLLAVARAEPVCADAGPLPACEASCLAGEAAACVRAAALKLVAGDAAGAQVSWDQGCALGEAQACHLLASVVEPERALALETRACEAGLAVACARADALRGPPVEATPEETCDLGSAEVCYTLANAHPPKSPIRKARLLQACTLGHGQACAALEALSRRPLDLPRSDAQR